MYAYRQHHVAGDVKGLAALVDLKVLSLSATKVEGDVKGLTSLIKLCKPLNKAYKPVDDEFIEAMLWQATVFSRCGAARART